MAEYAPRDIVKQGNHYARHLSAMTTEGLHDKSDIAAELAHRDMEIEVLRAEVRDAYAAADSKAGWEWKKRAEQAEARAERLAEALRDLLDQLEGVGIYIPGEDSGQWAGTEGISFTQAEAALQPL